MVNELLIRMHLLSIEHCVKRKKMLRHHYVMLKV